jgi:hypothetical protein
MKYLLKQTIKAGLTLAVLLTTWCLIKDQLPRAITRIHFTKWVDKHEIEIHKSLYKGGIVYHIGEDDKVVLIELRDELAVEEFNRIIQKP